MSRVMDDIKREAVYKEKKENVIGMIKEGINLEVVARISRLTVEQVYDIGKKAMLI